MEFFTFLSKIIPTISKVFIFISNRLFNRPLYIKKTYDVNHNRISDEYFKYLRENFFTTLKKDDIRFITFVTIDFENVSNKELKDFTIYLCPKNPTFILAFNESYDFNCDSKIEASHFLGCLSPEHLHFKFTRMLSDQRFSILLTTYYHDDIETHVTPSKSKSNKKIIVDIESKIWWNNFYFILKWIVIVFLVLGMSFYGYQNGFFDILVSYVKNFCRP